MGQGAIGGAGKLIAVEAGGGGLPTRCRVGAMVGEMGYSQGIVQTNRSYHGLRPQAR